MSATSNWLLNVPLGLILFRVACGPVLLLDAWDGACSLPFWPIVFTLAVISDILDGIVARRLRIDTRWLREADSRADVILYLFVGVAIHRAHPDTLMRWRILLLIMLASHLAQWTSAIYKFGRLASYHSWTAKLWGVSLGIATGFLFSFDYETALWGCVICGVVSNVHEIMITCTLSEWTHDVWDIRTAAKLRKRVRGAQRKVH
jgi:phosphatidylglycerophosphate synthase